MNVVARLKVEYPTGSGQELNLLEVAIEIATRLRYTAGSADGRSRAPRAQRRRDRDRRLLRHQFDFDRAILEFSHAYAEQNERNYQKLTEAVSS
ncbi:MAG: hypothetical protein ACLP01_02820 [Solirubrobacteraceae bacterium]